MQYLLDTVTIVRHFSQVGRIGNTASKILHDCIENSDHFYISVISLMEIMYLSEKKRIKINLSDTIKQINKSSNYTIISLFPDILIVAENLQFYELHDRIILSTAKWLDIPVISSDKRFDEVKDIKRIWD